MIKIENKKLKVEILFDENVNWIQFSPRDYEDKPYVIIEMKNFNFFEHVKKCCECKKFIDSFGKETTDWFISYNKKIFRLDTKEIGIKTYPSNKITITNSDYNPGTKLILLFHEFQANKNELEKLLVTAIENEDYERACILRDLINELIE